MPSLTSSLVAVCVAWSALSCTGSDSTANGSAGAAGMFGAGGGESGGAGAATSSQGGATLTASGGVTGSGGATSKGGATGSGGSVTCGTAVCTTGQYCCNASCSMCAPTGAACIQVVCDSTTEAGCNSAADCRLFDDYCGGCNCTALAKTATAPSCNGTTVNCLVAPCANKSVACTNGVCTSGS